MNKEFRLIDAECLRQQRNMDATHDPKARAALATQSKNWCEMNMRELDQAYSGKSEEYWRHYRLWFGDPPANATEREIDDQVREARFYVFGRIAFLAIETLAAGVLAVMFFNAPPVFAAIIGVGLALLLGAAATSGVARWIRHESAMQPVIQLARVSRGLLWTFIPWLLAVVAALSVLRNEASRFGAVMFLAMTTVVTLLSPICCGLCTYAGDLLFWSPRLCGDLRWLRALGRRLHHLHAASEQCLPAPPQNMAVRNLRLIRPPATIPVVLLAAALVFGHAAKLRAEDLPIHIYPDVSPSVRLLEVRNVLKEFSARLDQYEGPNTLVISLVPFFSDAYSATPILRIRIAGGASAACDGGAVPASEIGRLAKNYAEAGKRDAMKQCEALRNEARAEANRQRRSEIAKFNVVIERLGELKMPGRCTAVNAMIRRALRETPSGISILISDLENDCPLATLAPHTGAKNRLFIVPVGSRTRPVEQWFDAAQTRFSQILPEAKIIEPFNIDSVFQAFMAPDVRIALARH